MCALQYIAHSVQPDCVQTDEGPAVAEYTTWVQQHTADEAMNPAAFPRWHLPSSPITPSNPPVRSSQPVYLTNPLRLDPTPPPASPQSDNPIRTHTAS